MYQTTNRLSPEADDAGSSWVPPAPLLVGDGCVIDQLIGDTYAQLSGLPHVFDPDHVKTALASIHRLNCVSDFGDWTNYMRTYAVRGERGHIVLSYPNGLPEHPMPYWCEAWTGLEYAYAIGLVQAGEEKLAEDVVMAVRERFSGRRRNPFNEAECGYHYARALASWGLVVALTGFGYDARSGVMSFASLPKSGGTLFWSSGAAWGTIGRTALPQGDEEELTARLDVHAGKIRVTRVKIGRLDLELAHPGQLAVGSYKLRAITTNLPHGG